MRPFTKTGKKALYINISLFLLTGLILYWGSNVFSDTFSASDSTRTIVKIWDLLRFTSVLVLITNLFSFAEAGYSGYLQHKGTSYTMYGMILFPVLLVFIMPVTFISVVKNLYTFLLPLAIIHATSFEYLTKYYVPFIERNWDRFDDDRHRLV
ncbi:hypothetical protein CK503_04090 [Aliifodinibius salipaludis]|uniref:Uncharacterized protein n=1 Tax=Fodinibius salipaludis TaxID=2032627 RepID=A0A2A2GER6_9BACT|nr:hypothetical protein CK503_04090 [Aliifodinibius salipaludis]